MEALQPLGDDEPAAVGPYRLLGRLGSGGMGRVYLGRSAGGRTVAVKIVHPHFALDEQFRARFRREVDAARRVGGAWTAPVLDADPQAAVPWVATAYAAGPSVAAAVTDLGPLPPATVRALGAGLAEALTAVHAAGLVHRDVKPSNVLLTLDGPLLIDFGIARATDGTASLTSTGVSVDSPGYMAPEQILGRDVTGAADVFSLGALLAYAATGEPPFTGDSSAALLYQVVHGEPRLGALPDGLRDVVVSCLAKDPSSRPAPPELATHFAPAGTTSLITDGWLPPTLLERVSRSAVRLLNLEAGAGRVVPGEGGVPGPHSGAGAGAGSGVGAGSAAGVAQPGAPAEASVSGPVAFSSPAVVGRFGPPPVMRDPGAAEFPAGSSAPASGAGSSAPASDAVTPDAVAPDVAQPGPGSPARAIPSPPPAPEAVTPHPGRPVPGPETHATPHPPGPAVAAAAVPRGRPGKVSLTVAAAATPGEGGRGRRVSCSVALAVAGALAAVTVGSAFVFDLLPGNGGGTDAGGAPHAPHSSAPADTATGTAPSTVPARYLGTWEGQATALDGTLPLGTFRLTVHRAGVGEELGTLRQTDQLGGHCDDVLTLKQVTRTQLVATSAGARTNHDGCNPAPHTVRLTPAGDDLTFTSESDAEGRPRARLSKVG